MIFKTIIIEDTIESLENALRELDKAMKEGGGIGFDLRALNKKGQEIAIQRINEKVNIVIPHIIRKAINHYSTDENQ